MKSIVISQGNVKIMSYADIVEVQRKRAAKADARKPKLLAKSMQYDAQETSDEEAEQMAGLYPQCPGRAPVSKMW